MKTVDLKWFSMSSLIGCRLKFQMDQSPSPKSRGLLKMSKSWINWGNEEAGCKWQPVFFLQTIYFLQFWCEIMCRRSSCATVWPNLWWGCYLLLKLPPKKAVAVQQFWTGINYLVRFSDQVNEVHCTGKTKCLLALFSKQVVQTVFCFLFTLCLLLLLWGSFISHIVARPQIERENLRHCSVE